MQDAQTFPKVEIKQCNDNNNTLSSKQQLQDQERIQLPFLSKGVVNYTTKLNGEEGKKKADNSSCSSSSYYEEEEDEL
ncbi:MAG: hypothetical protein ACK53Y_15240, partial [bacterium]